MKRFTLGLALAALTTMVGSAVAGSLPEVVIGPGTGAAVRTPYCQSFNRVLDADTCYVMTGLYYVEPGFDLTIQPGTTIKGHKPTGATLIITKGATIHAQGTAQRPIVFTSTQAPGARAPGDWGGIIVLGDAPVNKVNPVIEGGLILGSCVGGSTTYGGADANDNSGVLSYIRIEFCGFRFQQDNEVNGLTMGGVGAGTQIDHIQVSYSNDDAFEWFGGTVNCSYLATLGTTDDEFDTDFGFTGKVQFGFALRDPNFSDPTGQSNGFESDNDGSSTSTATPYTRPIFSNMTLVGPERTNALVGAWIGTYQYSMLLRRSTKTNIYNTTVLGYPWGVALRDASTQANATANDLKVRKVSLAATLIPAGSTNIHQDTAAGWTNVDVWFTTAGWDNLQNATRNPDTILLNDLSVLSDPDPRPKTGSELIGSADFTDPDLAGLTVTTYRGAFPPTAVASKAQLWTAYWTEWDPQTEVYCDSVDVYTGVGGDDPKYGESHLGQNYPNPFNPMTSIDYRVTQSGKVTLEVYSATGAKVRTLVNDVKKAGSYTASFNADGMASGVYFYRLRAVGVDEMKKMVLLK